MKSLRMIAVFALGSAVSLLIGCSQQEPTTPAPPAQVEKSAAPAVATPKPAETPAPAAVAAPEPAPVVASAPAVAAPAEVAPDPAQSQIDNVKGLIAEKKYPEALAALKNLSAMKLTPDQQTMADGLKAEVQKAMQAEATSEATKSVGGLLGK
jgi:outer membrane biosynthesis protein TonB